VYTEWKIEIQGKALKNVQEETKPQCMKGMHHKASGERIEMGEQPK